MSEGAELESDLPDLSAIDLRRLLATSSSVLDNSLRRRLEQAKELPDQYVAFQNAISPVAHPIGGTRGEFRRSP